MTDSTPSKIMRNSAFNVLRGMISLPIALILTPMVVNHLGIRGFGIWSLFFVFIQSAGLLDLGISSSLIKFVAEWNEKREFHKLNQMLNSALFVYGLLGMIFLVGVWFSRDSIVRGLFKSAASEQQYLTRVLMLATAVFVLQLVSSVLSALLQGLQRIDLFNLISVLVLLMHFGLVVAGLRSGYGLMTLIAAQGFAVAIGIWASVAASKQVFPHLRLHPDMVRLRAVRELIPLSLSVQCLSLQTIVFYQFDKIVLSVFGGPALAGYYDIAARPLNSLRSIPLTVVQPLVPAVSELQARRDRELIQEIFRRSHKYVMLGAVPVFVLVMVLANPLLALWFGERIPAGADLIAMNLRLLAATYLINVLGGTISYVALGLGDQKSILRYSLIATFLHAGLTVLLVLQLGYIGAPLAALVATCVAVAYYYVSFCRAAEFRLEGLLGMALRTLGPSLGLALLSFGLVSRISWFNGRLQIGFLVLLYFSLFTLLILATGYLTRGELFNLRSFLAGFFRDLRSSIRSSSVAFAKRWFRIFVYPEQHLKRVIINRFGHQEKSDELDFRKAVLWGWGLDRFRRNVVVAGKIREAKEKSPLLVLDVGASDAGVRPYLPEDGFSVYNLDIDWNRLASNGLKSCSVAADGCLLPFGDRTFDVVASVDCLEHVAPVRRHAYLLELQRVARKRIILHFPAVGSPHFQGGNFDRWFHKTYTLTLRRDHNIEEHLQNGLPDVDEVARYFPGCVVSGRENGYLWLKYMLFERMPYVGFLTGLLLLPFRRWLDRPPYHAALLVYEKQDPAQNSQVGAERIAAEVTRW